MKNEKLTFAIDEIKLIQEISDSQLAIAEVKVCHTGMNLHEKPISIETLKKAEQTIINKWLVAGFDGLDFKGHEGKSQMIIGFFPKENNFRYVEENDKTYLIINAIVSKMYAEWAFDILKDTSKECSMEITVLETEEKEDGYEWITSFVFNAVTILGKSHTPACPGSEIEIVKFSTDAFIEDVEKILNGLDVENFSTEDIKNSTKKEDEQMVFNREEFAVQFSMTANTMWSLLQDSCNAVKYGEHEYSRYWMSDYDANYLYCYDEEEGGKVAIPYAFEEGNVKCYFENAKPCKAVTTWVILEEKETVDFDPMMEMAKAMMTKEKNESFAKEDCKDEEKMAKEEDKEDEKPEDKEDKKEEFSVEDIKVELEDLKTKFITITTELETTKQNFETLSTENEQLKTFKTDIEEKEKLSRIEFAISEVMEDVPQEKVEEFRTKVEEFATIDAWENWVKAEAFGFTKGKSTNKPRGFALPFPTETKDKKSGSVWNNL